MINNPKDIQEILTALDNTTKKQLDKAIKNVDEKWSEKELNEDIKVLEEILNRKIEDTEGTKRMKQAIENLINRNKELEEEHQKRIMLALNKELVIVNNKMYTIDKELYNDLLNDTINNYIPKSKVREKIEDIEWEIERCPEDNRRYILVLMGKRNSLLELLQEGDDK